MRATISINKSPPFHLNANQNFFTAVFSVIDDAAARLFVEFDGRGDAVGIFVCCSRSRCRRRRRIVLRVCSSSGRRRPRLVEITMSRAVRKHFDNDKIRQQMFEYARQRRWHRVVEKRLNANFLSDHAEIVNVCAEKIRADNKRQILPLHFECEIRSHKHLFSVNSTIKCFNPTY